MTEISNYYRVLYVPRDHEGEYSFLYYTEY